MPRGSWQERSDPARSEKELCSASPGIRRCMLTRGARFMRHTRIIVTRYGGRDALQVVEEECP